MASFCLGLNVIKAERETIDCFNIGYPFETHHKHKATKKSSLSDDENEASEISGCWYQLLDAKRVSLWIGQSGVKFPLS